MLFFEGTYRKLNYCINCTVRLDYHGTQVRRCPASRVFMKLFYTDLHVSLSCLCFKLIFEWGTLLLVNYQELRLVQKDFLTCRVLLMKTLKASLKRLQ